MVNTISNCSKWSTLFLTMDSVPLSMWTNLLGLTAPASQTRVPCLQELFFPVSESIFLPPPLLVWYLFFLSLPNERLCILWGQHVRLLKCWSRRNKSFPANCAIFPTHRHCIFAPSEIYSETRKKDAESWFLLIQLEKYRRCLFSPQWSRFQFPSWTMSLKVVARCKVKFSTNLHYFSPTSALFFTSNRQQPT